MRGSVVAPRLEIFTRHRRIDNTKFRRWRRRTRRNDFFSAFDGCYLPGIDSATFEGLWRRPRSVGKLWAGDYLTALIIVNFNDVARRAIEQRPAGSRTSREHNYSDAGDHCKLVALVVVASHP